MLNDWQLHAQKCLISHHIWEWKANILTIMILKNLSEGHQKNPVF